MRSVWKRSNSKIRRKSARAPTRRTASGSMPARREFGAAAGPSMGSMVDTRPVVRSQSTPGTTTDGSAAKRLRDPLDGAGLLAEVESPPGVLGEFGYRLRRPEREEVPSTALQAMCE